jgi:hypothetical protein
VCIAKEAIETGGNVEEALQDGVEQERRGPTTDAVGRVTEGWMEVNRAVIRAADGT